MNKLTKYYIIIDAERKGPFTIDTIDFKTISSDTLIWHEGLSGWTKAINIDEFSELLLNVPPPIPDEVLQNEPTINVKLKKSKNGNFRNFVRKTTIILSKELILFLKLTCLGIIIGIIVFPIIYFLIKNPRQLKEHFEDEKQRLTLNLHTREVVTKKADSLTNLALNNPESRYFIENQKIKSDFKLISEEKENLDSIVKLPSNSSAEKYWEKIIAINNRYGELDASGKQLEFQRKELINLLGLTKDEVDILRLYNYFPNSTNFIYLHEEFDNNINSLKKDLDRRLDWALWDSINLSGIGISLGFFLMIFRYIYFTGRWIVRNSKKEI